MNLRQTTTFNRLPLVYKCHQQLAYLILQCSNFDVLIRSHYLVEVGELLQRHVTEVIDTVDFSRTGILW